MIIIEVNFHKNRVKNNLHQHLLSERGFVTGFCEGVCSGEINFCYITLQMRHGIA